MYHTTHLITARLKPSCCQIDAYLVEIMGRAVADYHLEKSERDDLLGMPGRPEEMGNVSRQLLIGTAEPRTDLVIVTPQSRRCLHMFSSSA